MAKSFKLNLSSTLRFKPKSRTETANTASPPSSSSSNNTTPKSSNKETELRQVFCYFDSNSDGKISAEELRAYFLSVGDSVTQEEAENVINEFDKDGDKLLEFTDFVRLMKVDDDDDEGQKEEEIKKAFEMYEVEKGSGCITPRGLQLVLKRLGDVRSLEECKAMIGAFDLDGNGVLDFNEFQKMMS